MSSILDTVITFVADKSRLSPDKIGPATAYEDLGLDSLVLVELAVVLQKQFGIEVDEDELVDAATVGGTATLVESKGVAA